MERLCFPPISFVLFFALLLSCRVALPRNNSSPQGKLSLQAPSQGAEGADESGQLSVCGAKIIAAPGMASQAGFQTPAKNSSGRKSASVEQVLAARLAEAKAADNQLENMVQNSHSWDEHDSLLMQLLDCRNAAWERVAAQLKRGSIHGQESHQALLQVSESLMQSRAQLLGNISFLRQANAHLWFVKPLNAAVEITSALEKRVDQLLPAASPQNAGQQTHHSAPKNAR